MLDLDLGPVIADSMDAVAEYCRTQWTQQEIDRFIRALGGRTKDDVDDLLEEIVRMHRRMDKLEGEKS